MKKALYMECSSGISGDMSVAALLGLGADPHKLTETLKTLPLQGYQVQITTVVKSGISAYDFNVILDSLHENNDHNMEYLHGDSHHANPEYNSSIHTMEAKHHVPDHSNHPEHMHRNLSDIFQILEASSMTQSALYTAKKIFRILAEGEAEAHGISIENVHFHEVGAVDSIVDIASFSICLDMLGYKEVFVPALYDGTGTIRCQHGILPIPVPATANIIKKYQIPLSIQPVQGELVTPTGAAIAASISTSFKLPSSFQIIKTGIGAGKRNYKNTSGILRFMEIEYI